MSFLVLIMGFEIRMMVTDEVPEAGFSLGVIENQQF